MTAHCVELEVKCVTRSRMREAYALMLCEKEGTRRVPIVVGMAEAQSIAVRLEGIIPPRPLTHDLMSSVFHAFGIELSKVTITTFDNGVFSSVLTVTNGDVETELDSRTSDAIALALRTGAPIYATEDVMSSASYDPTHPEQNDARDLPTKLEDMSDDRLKARMQHHVELEEYEQAAQIQKILESRRQEK